MAEPFVFHFRPGEHGQPQVMYIADLSCACTLCGHPQLQRFYHATDIHPLTWETLHRLSDGLANKVSYECEQCGTPATPAFVTRTVLIYGSPDHTFELYLYRECASNTTTYQLKLNRKLDPQVQPRFAPEPTAEHVFDDMDEATFELLSGRVFNLKWSIVALVHEWAQDTEGGAYAQISPGCWVFIHDSPESVDEMVAHAQHTDLILATLTPVGLFDSVPDGLATHDHPESMPGQWRTWFPSSTLEMIDAGDCYIEVFVAEDEALDAMRGAFDTARLTYDIDDDDEDGSVIHDITTPREDVYARDVFVDDVLRRAVFTGLTPGEAGRLTAEEIVGLLMQVWHD